MPALPGRVADTWVPGGGGGGGTSVHGDLTGRDAADQHPTAAITDLDAELAALIPLTQKAAANGVATLDGTSKIPAAQIPAIALSEYLGSVASEAAMLALVGQRGDWCIRTDLDPDSIFLLESDDPTQAANWTNVTGPGVVSVDGQTGAALIVTQTITNGVTNRAPSEDAVFDALALKAPAANPTFTGNVVVPDADAATEAMNRQASDARYIKLPAGAPSSASQILGLSDDDPLTTDWIDPPAGGGWTLIDEDHLTRTAGDVTAASAAFTEISTGLRLTLQGAQVGDVVKYGAAGWGSGSTGADYAVNAATIVSGAIQNQMVAGTRAGPIGYLDSTASKPVTGQARYTLTAGDIVAGAVTLTLIGYASGGTLTLQADATYSLQVWAELLRPPA